MSIITNMIVNNILFSYVADHNRKAQEEHEKRMKDLREQREKASKGRK